MGCKDHDRPEGGCPQACRQMMLDLMAESRAGLMLGVGRIAGMSLLCGVSAVVGVLICKLVG